MSELSPKQHKAIASLLARGTVPAAAEDAEIGERQVYRWLRDPDFRSELQRQQSELTDAALRLLVSGASTAVAVMRQIMSDGNNPPGIRLRAAESVLANILRIQEHTELSERMAAVEAAIAQDMLMAAVAENSDPVQPARRVIDYRLKLKPPPGYTDGDDQSAP